MAPIVLVETLVSTDSTVDTRGHESNFWDPQKHKFLCFAYVCSYLALIFIPHIMLGCLSLKKTPQYQTRFTMES